jgi:hypothetical protein
MAVMIDWDNRVILQCSNSIMYGLYLSILDAIDDFNLNLNKDISKLVNRLDVAADGIGFDLKDYIHNKPDLEAFIKIVRMGIDKHYEEIPELPQRTKDRLEGFYQELLNVQKNYQKALDF